MADSKPKIPLSLRWAAISLAVLSFIWLPVEDTTVSLLLALSLGWCAWVGIWWLHRGSPPRQPARLLITGAAAGLAVSPLAFFLALLKAGLHDHGFLDFTDRQLVLIAWTTPGWVFLGLLVGVWYWRRLTHDQNS